MFIIFKHLRQIAFEPAQVAVHLLYCVVQMLYLGCCEESTHRLGGCFFGICHIVNDVDGKEREQIGVFLPQLLHAGFDVVGVEGKQILVETTDIEVQFYARHVRSRVASATA